MKRKAAGNIVYKTLGFKRLFERSAPHKVQRNLTAKSPAIPNVSYTQPSDCLKTSFPNVLLACCLLIIYCIDLIYYLSNNKYPDFSPILFPINLEISLNRLKFEQKFGQNGGF